MILVDTSAWYALLDEDDNNHNSAVERWHALLASSALLTHAYLVVETSALVQRRLGMRAAKRLHHDLLPAASETVIDLLTHRRAVERWKTSARRNLSLVDVTSFIVMEDRGVDTAFAYDDDFTAAGFRLFSTDGGTPGGSAEREG